MKLTQIACRTCGGPVEIPEGASQVTCPFCGSRLAIERQGSEAVMDAAERISGAIDGSAEHTGAAIGESAERVSGAIAAAAGSMGTAVLGAGQGTREAIHENTLVAEAALDRLTWSQQLLSAETQLTAVQSELRALARQKATHTTRQQMRDLHVREQELQGRIAECRAAMAQRRAGGGGDAGDAGTPQGAGAARAADGKNWGTAVALCTLLGPLGAHRFYTGHVRSGLLQLVTLGAGGLWSLYDLSRILSGRFTDKQGRPLAGRDPALGAGCFTALLVMLGFALLALIARQDNTDAANGFLIIGAVAGAVVFVLRYAVARGAQRRAERRGR